MSAAPPSPKRVVRWAAGLLLAGAAASLAATHSVPFSVLLPEAERVYLLGSFNDWNISDDALMTNDHGVWRKTLSLEKGEHAYKFKAEGARIAGDGWRLDWKASRENRSEPASFHSVLVVPDDLKTFRARQRRAQETSRGIEIPLFYDLHPSNSASFRPSGYFICPLETAPPAGEWKLPVLTDDQPLFTTVPLGDSTVLAVLDRHPADAHFYNRVYFDRNGNRDLTDDPPIDGDTDTPGQRYFFCAFPPVDLEIEAGGHRMPYRLTMQAGGNLPAQDPSARYDPEQLRKLHFFTSPQCAYLGEAMVDGVGYRFAIGDTMANGFFGDIARLNPDIQYPNQQLYAEGDSFYLSTDARVGPADGLLLGNFLAVGHRLFAVHLDVPGGKLTLEPRTENVGALEIPAAVDSMALLAASGDQGVMLRRVGGKVAIPSGTWRLLDYRIEKTDEWGDTWSLQSSGAENTPALAVPDRETVPLAIGEPLRTVVKISDDALRQAAAGRPLKLELAILGNANEVVDGVRHASGTQTQHKMSKRRSDRPGEAIYRIIKPDGELITSGSFEYG